MSFISRKKVDEATRSRKELTGNRPDPYTHVAMMENADLMMQCSAAQSQEIGPSVSPNEFQQMHQQCSNLVRQDFDNDERYRRFPGESQDQFEERISLMSRQFDPDNEFTRINMYDVASASRTLYYGEFTTEDLSRAHKIARSISDVVSVLNDSGTLPRELLNIEYDEVTGEMHVHTGDHYDDALRGFQMRNPEIDLLGTFSSSHVDLIEGLADNLNSSRAQEMFSSEVISDEDPPRSVVIEYMHQHPEINVVDRAVINLKRMRRLNKNAWKQYSQRRSR